MTTGGCAKCADKVLVKGSGGHNGATHKMRVCMVRNEHFTEVKRCNHIRPKSRNCKVATKGYTLGHLLRCEDSCIVRSGAHEPASDVLVAKEVTPEIRKHFGTVRSAVSCTWPIRARELSKVDHVCQGWLKGERRWGRLGLGNRRNDSRLKTVGKVDGGKDSGWYKIGVVA